MVNNIVERKKAMTGEKKNSCIKLIAYVVLYCSPPTYVDTSVEEKTNMSIAADNNHAAEPRTKRTVSDFWCFVVVDDHDEQMFV